MRILAVDDDPDVLQGLTAALSTLSEHQIGSANGGEAALQVAAEAGVDLLVTDVVMDGLDGLSLRGELQARFPALRTVFISGYDLSEYAEAIGGAPLLAKPLDHAALRAAVESELAQIAAPEPPPPAPEPVVAVPVPVARPAAPIARPAVPVARAAVPVAKPSAPTARPAAPMARPAVPTAPPSAPAARPAAPTARPAAPTARPATPSVRPAAPTARPAVAKAAAPGAGPAAPKAVAAAPRAVPVAAPKAVVSAPAPATPLPSEPVRREPSAALLELLGKAIGGYQIVSLLGEGRWGPVFAAVQVAINRPVGLKVLDPERATDPEQKQRFIADARAKANVQHPSILAVYEAGAAEGWIFYTQEFVDGQNLAEMASTGAKIDQPTALKILRTAAEGAVYFERSTTPHTPLTADSIYLGADGQPRLSNPATQHSDRPSSAAAEIDLLGRAILALLPAGPEITTALRSLLGRMLSTNSAPVANWGALLQGIKALEPKVVPVEAERISAQDRAAVEAVERARQQQKRAFRINVGAMISLLLLAVGVAYFVFIRSNERRLTAQIHIPAGEFISGGGVNSTNEEFWIDKYEVTIGQYAKFVQWILANPADEREFDHPRQPRGLSHIPQYWEVYYGNALSGKAAHSVPISLNSPMMTVTWWDAYAYAKWKDRELPSALEWERAARGKTGAAYPWGEAPEVKRANTSADYQPRLPGAKGSIDGFNFWGDVDRQAGDKSPEGVIGMAGNVSEWTNTWTKGNKNPILKGGNFSIPLLTMDAEISDKPADSSQEYIGFRTISRKAPAK